MIGDIVRREEKNYGSRLKELEVASDGGAEVINWLRENKSERHLHTHRAD